MRQSHQMTPRKVKAAHMKRAFPSQDIIFGLGGGDYPAYVCGFHSSIGKARSLVTRQLFSPMALTTSG